MIFSVFLPSPPVFPAYGRKKGGSARHSSTGEAALVFSSAPLEMLNPERKPAYSGYFCIFEFIVCNAAIADKLPCSRNSSGPKSWLGQLKVLSWTTQPGELSNLEKRVVGAEWTAEEDDGGFR
jgi:hypothetical protein